MGKDCDRSVKTKYVRAQFQWNATLLWTCVNWRPLLEWIITWHTFRVGTSQWQHQYLPRWWKPYHDHCHARQSCRGRFPPGQPDTVRATKPANNEQSWSTGLYESVRGKFERISKCTHYRRTPFTPAFTQFCGENCSRFHDGQICSLPLLDDVKELIHTTSYACEQICLLSLLFLWDSFRWQMWFSDVLFLWLP